MKTISIDELSKMIEPGRKNPILINTLAPENFQKGHIPGSINIPSDQIAQKAKGLFSPHDWIVVYCANSKCTASKEAGDALTKIGFTNVFRFEGGIEEWKQHSKYTNTDTKAA